jgi:hypothetical protein
MSRRRLAAAALLLAGASLVPLRAWAQAATGPLSVSPTNRRYFQDPTGKVVVLTGSHTWLNLNDAGTGFPPPVFNYAAHLAWLQGFHHNFIRLWRWEQSRWTAETSSDNYWFNPGVPYLRTGPGNALDGRLRYDLNQLDPAYFDRLRQRTQQAGAAGIYVAVMLFNGWSVADNGPQLNNPWKGHPFNAANNVNGVNGDSNGDGRGREVHTLGIPAVTAIEDAYVRRVVDAVNDLDNVLYEICNECNAGSQDWQYHMIDLIHAYEAQKPKRHPVGMTVEFPGGTNAELFASAAEWVSPTTDYGAGNVINTPQKVVLTDTDHICGVCDDGNWVWRSFMSGANPIFMDVYDGLNNQGVGGSGFNPNAAMFVSARRTQGQVWDYASRMPLGSMVPSPGLSSTGQAMAGGGQLLAFRQANTGNVTVNLTGIPGTLNVEWLNVNTGATTQSTSVTGGASRTLTPPAINGPAVVYLRPPVPVELMGLSVE